MKAKAYLIIVCISWLLFFHIGCVAFLPRPPEAQVSAPPLALAGLIIGGRLVQQTERGEIQVIRKGQPLSPVYAGLPIETGDQIRTAQNAEAIVDFEHGIQAYLASNTQVSLSSAQVTQGEVLVRRIQEFFLKIKGQFDLGTGNASAIAQGTEYYVKVGDREASYVVLEGRVLVKPKPPATWQPIYLGQNEKVILAKDQPPRGPLPTDPREIAAILQWRDRLERMMSTDPVKEGIDRIQRGKHIPIPPQTIKPTPGVAGTRVTITNGTGNTLRIYFRGPVSRLLEVPNGQSREVSLVAGRYQLAAETSNPRIIPFYAERTYAPNTSYQSRFYLRPR
jgi:hypothetical protein